MTRKYYTLASRKDVNHDWEIEFGDYDLDTVIYERDEYLSGYSHYKRTNLKVIKHKSDLQTDIDADYLALNGRNPGKVIQGNV